MECNLYPYLSQKYKLYFFHTYLSKKTYLQSGGAMGAD
nr:MAG TPA: hypothetical protein [Caudoviricetes sp.]